MSWRSILQEKGKLNSSFLAFDTSAEDRTSWLLCHACLIFVRNSQFTYSMIYFPIIYIRAKTGSSGGTQVVIPMEVLTQPLPFTVFVYHRLPVQSSHSPNLSFADPADLLHSPARPYFYFYSHPSVLYVHFFPSQAVVMCAHFP